MRFPFPLAPILALCSIASAGAWAQAPADSGNREAVRALLRAQRVDSQFVAALDLTFGEVEADPELPPGFMDSLRVRARRSVGTFVERLVPVYDSLFTDAEVAGLTAFFESPLGQRLVAAQPALTAAAVEMSQRWGMELTAEVLLEMSRQPVRRP